MTIKPTTFDHLTPPSLRDGHRPYVLQTARIGHDPEQIKRLLQRDPDSAPSETLPLLIVEHSLEEFIEPGLSEEAQRALIKAAPRLHQIKGKPQGIKYALEALGIHADFVDWFEASPEAPRGTFEITAYISDQLFPGHQLLSPKAVRQIWRLIREMQRESQKAYLKVGEQYSTNIHVRAATRPITRSEIVHTPKPPTHNTEVTLSICAHTQVRVVSHFTHNILTNTTMGEAV